MFQITIKTEELAAKYKVNAIADALEHLADRLRCGDYAPGIHGNLPSMVDVNGHIIGRFLCTETPTGPAELLDDLASHPIQNIIIDTTGDALTGHHRVKLMAHLGVRAPDQSITVVDNSAEIIPKATREKAIELFRSKYQIARPGDAPEK